MEEKTQLKYHGFLEKTENRTIYYKGQMKNDNEEKTKQRKQLFRRSNCGAYRKIWSCE